ncbi:hypothetical protein NHJ13051_003930 [Beauveria bassiana]
MPFGLGGFVPALIGEPRNLLDSLSQMTHSFPRRRFNGAAAGSSQLF